MKSLRRLHPFSFPNDTAADERIRRNGTTTGNMYINIVNDICLNMKGGIRVTSRYGTRQNETMATAIRVSVHSMSTNVFGIVHVALAGALLLLPTLLK